MTAANVDTGIKVTTETNDAGVYVFPFLQPGNYRLATEMPGFKPIFRSGVKLDVQQVARIDWQLEVGTLDQEVTVAAKTPRLESETSSIGQVVENKTIVTLPLNGRNYSQLALLMPGAVPNPGSRASDAFSLNGNRTLQNNFMIDGIDNTNHIFGTQNNSTQALRPSIDAIREFKVETANYSAEFGRAAGGVISVALKSGTNEFHGSAFEFLRNDTLDANDFFSNRAGLNRPPLRYNQFGATIGGPLLRNRTFFFVSYQGTRIRQSDTVTVTVPTPEMRLGKFGLFGIYDPLNVVNEVRQPFPNNTIPEDRMDSVGRRLVALYPSPNLPGVVNNYTSNVGIKDEGHQVDLRVDHRIAAADHLFVRYSDSPRQLSRGSVFAPPGNGANQGAQLDQLPQIKPMKAYSVGVHETHTFSSALVNEARAGYIRIGTDVRTPAPSPLFEEFGIRGIPLFSGLTGLPQIVLSGFSMLGDRVFTPNPIQARVLQLSDTLSLVRGNHTLKFGGDLRCKNNSVLAAGWARGVFTFTGQFTARVPGQGSGSALADLLLGQTSSARLTTLLVGDMYDRYYSFFVDDTWRLSRRLTLNLGLRYELQTPLWERENRMSNFDPDPRSPTLGQLVPARSGSIRARTFMNPDTHNVAPRVGFAYSVDPTTVVRGAFGIFYGGLGYQALSVSGASNPPYLVDITLSSPNTAARSATVLSDGFPPGTLDPRYANDPAVYALEPDFRMPKIYQWNVGLQREWISDLVLSLAYVGSGSLHLRAFSDINAPAPGPGPFNPRRPFPNFGSVTLISSFAHATYHSLQAKAEKRFSEGFALLTSYTWSHTIDNSTDAGDIVNLGMNYPQNAGNIRAEKGPSEMDVRHRWVSSVIYDLPIGRRGGWLGNSNVIRALFRGWQLGGIFAAQSGPPLSPRVNRNVANITPPTLQRPDRLRDGNLSRGVRGVDRWFDPSAFAPAALYTFGNSGRNVLRAPGLVNLDWLVARNFQITEAKRLELRGEFFNLTNTAHFGRPNAIIDLLQAGRITATQWPNRQVQIGLRFVF